MSTVTTSDIQQAVSLQLQRRFHTEKHGCKWLQTALRCGARKARALLYGEQAPTAADLINIIRASDPAFAELVLNPLTGGKAGARDKAAAEAFAERLEMAAQIIRREAERSGYGREFD